MQTPEAHSVLSLQLRHAWLSPHTGAVPTQVAASACVHVTQVCAPSTSHTRGLSQSLVEVHSHEPIAAGSTQRSSTTCAQLGYSQPPELRLDTADSASTIQAALQRCVLVDVKLDDRSPIRVSSPVVTMAA